MGGGSLGRQSTQVRSRSRHRDRENRDRGTQESNIPADRVPRKEAGPDLLFRKQTSSRANSERLISNYKGNTGVAPNSRTCRWDHRDIYSDQREMSLTSSLKCGVA